MSSNNNNSLSIIITISCGLFVVETIYLIESGEKLFCALKESSTFYTELTSIREGVESRILHCKIQNSNQINYY